MYGRARGKRFLARDEQYCACLDRQHNLWRPLRTTQPEIFDVAPCTIIGDRVINYPTNIVPTVGNRIFDSWLIRQDSAGRIRLDLYIFHCTGMPLTGSTRYLRTRWLTNMICCKEASRVLPRACKRPFRFVDGARRVVKSTALLLFRGVESSYERIFPWCLVGADNVDTDVVSEAWRDVDEKVDPNVKRGFFLQDNSPIHTRPFLTHMWIARVLQSEGRMVAES